MGVPPVLIHVIFGFSMKTIQPSWGFLVHQAQRVQLKMVVAGSWFLWNNHHSYVQTKLD